MKLLLTLLSVCLIQVASAQTLRQMVLMADGIAICTVENKITDTVTLGDYHEYTAGTTTYTPHEWLKKPKGNNIPKKIVSKAITKKGYYDNVNCREMGVAWEPGSPPTAVQFLQFIENKWEVGYLALVDGKDMDSLRERINEINRAENIKDDRQRFYAMVNVILKNENDDFIKGGRRALRELDSTEVFMQYYRKKGITELLPRQQDVLAALLLPDIYNGAVKDLPYFYNYELINLAYARNKAAFDTALLKRLAAQYTLKKSGSENVYDYELRDLLSGIYTYNKNIKSLNEAVAGRFEEDALLQAVENVLKEVKYL